MKIKEVLAIKIKDSRKKNTIRVIVKTPKGIFTTSAPSGKSTGVHEVSCYKQSLDEDIRIINDFDEKTLEGFNLQKFEDLQKVEDYIMDLIGGNSLFALEASLLKAMAKENKKELWQFLGGKKKVIRPVGNTIGGGLHSKGIKGKTPDFQEFLFIANGKSIKENVEINKMAYKIAQKVLNGKTKNDEGAWETGLTNEQVLNIMFKIKQILERQNIKIDIGLDIAANSFYKNGKYNYKNSSKSLNREDQIKHIQKLIEKYNILYVEDPMDEDDFLGFKELNKTNAMIVGDDLTTTNPKRLIKAIKNKAIKAIIVKPNQIGSLLKVKEVIDISKGFGIKTIISHRSGETLDDTIADLGMGFGVDFIKTGTFSKYRTVKLKRLMKIEKKR
jgi:enolase